MKTLLLVGLIVSGLLAPAVILVAVFDGLGPSSGSSVSLPGGASAILPDPYPQLYAAGAALCPGMEPHLLEAVGQIESGHNRNDGPSSAGAVGPMQFVPSTWLIYGDGTLADAWLPPLAIPAAARMICANAGGRGDDRTALRKSLAIYNAGNADSPAGLAYADHAFVVELGLDLLSDPRVSLSENARSDVMRGVDPRLEVLLERAAAQWPISVGTLVTGHPTYVEGTGRVSNHACGRAADLTAVGGSPVSVTNVAARALVLWTASLAANKPDEVGSPWPDFGAFPGNYFQDPGTGPHVHLGFSGPKC